MDPERPPVTLTDYSVDLLQGGRDPWRPSRRQLRVAAVALAVLAGLGAGTAYGVDGWRERQAERDVLRSVALEVQEPAPWQADGAFRLDLHSRGPHPLHVLDLRVDGPGFPAVVVGRPLGSFGWLPVQLGVPTCDLALYTTTARTLLVGIETERGSRRTFGVPLGDVGSSLVQRWRERCGFGPPDQAFRPELVSARVRDAALVLVYEIRNDGRFPLTLQAVSGPRGVALTMSPSSLTVPVGEHPRRLTVTLRVVSCRAFSTQLVEERDLGVDVARDLQVALRHPYAGGTAVMTTNGRRGDPETGQFVVDNLVRLRDACPGWAFPSYLPGFGD